jgi:hypothetical protein
MHFITAIYGKPTSVNAINMRVNTRGLNGMIKQVHFAHNKNKTDILNENMIREFL